jgi:hypothetical protein
MRGSGRLVLIGAAALFYAVSGVAGAGGVTAGNYVKTTTCNVGKGQTKDCEVDCNIVLYNIGTGYDTATGGGYELEKNPRLQVIASEPAFSPLGISAAGWNVEVWNQNSLEPAAFDVYVLCDQRPVP